MAIFTEGGSLVPIIGRIIGGILGNIGGSNLGKNIGEAIEKGNIYWENNG